MRKQHSISLRYIFLASLLDRQKTVGNPLVMLSDKGFRWCSDDLSVKGQGEIFSALRLR